VSNPKYVLLHVSGPHTSKTALAFILEFFLWCWWCRSGATLVPEAYTVCVRYRGHCWLGLVHRLPSIADAVAAIARRLRCDQIR
jgi:hypothetical protein